jgi:hypothetical protein
MTEDSVEHADALRQYARNFGKQGPKARPFGAAKPACRVVTRNDEVAWVKGKRMSNTKYEPMERGKAAMRSNLTVPAVRASNDRHRSVSA